MPEVHLPHLESHSRGRSLLKLLLEVVLISLGVFVGLAGEQWRESRDHGELAASTLLRFQAELTANRAAVAGVTDYHIARATEIRAYLAAQGEERRQIPVRMSGIRFAAIERTVWDVALATGALAYIDADLVYEISHIYVAQDRLEKLTQGMTQAMYLQPPGSNREAFLQALIVYYGDTNVIEPQLIKMYDAVLPKLRG